MAIPLIIGMMNWCAMALVAAAITLERLPPGGRRIARATGVFIVGAGLLLMVRAAETA
jgi:predicted metal-binding membrane protein